MSSDTKLKITLVTTTTTTIKIKYVKNLESLTHFG